MATNLRVRASALVGVGAGCDHGGVYRERASVVPGAVWWTSTGSGGGAVLPDGCLDLLWLDDDLVVAGPDTAPQPSGGQPRPVTGLRFAPGVGPSVIGVPAVAVRDHRVPLRELWPAGQADRWRNLVARDPAALERLAGDRLGDRPAETEALLVARLCARGVRTERIAAVTGWSGRTLHRRSLAAFGYGSKTLTRVLRFRRALVDVRAGVALAEVAARHGYADQAHLTRDVGALAGRTPSALAR